MARIFKSSHAERKSIAAFHRSDLNRAGEEPNDPEDAHRSLNAEELREAILNEAREEAALRAQEAYEEGFRQGEEAGRAAFDAKVNQAGEMLQEAGRRMEEARIEFLENLEPQVLDLVGLIAQRVLDREMRTDPRIILSVARRALTQIVDREQIRFRVHPADYDALKNYRITLLEDFESVKKLEIEADETVGPGGCVAESGLMHIDARLETLLGHVLEAFQETETPQE